jgi:hypothetical protein
MLVTTPLAINIDSGNAIGSCASAFEGGFWKNSWNFPRACGTPFVEDP